MRKVISIMAVVALLFSVNVNAQEKTRKAKKKAKTEMATTTETATEKKECSATGAKKSCCASKKADETKS